MFSLCLSTRGDNPCLWSQVLFLGGETGELGGEEKGGLALSMVLPEGGGRERKGRGEGVPQGEQDRGMPPLPPSGDKTLAKEKEKGWRGGTGTPDSSVEDRIPSPSPPLTSSLILPSPLAPSQEMGQGSSSRSP